MEVILHVGFGGRAGGFVGERGQGGHRGRGDDLACRGLGGLSGCGGAALQRLTFSIFLLVARVLSDPRQVGRGAQDWRVGEGDRRGAVQVILL